MDDHKEEDFRSYGIRLGEYCSKLLPCLTGEWLERLMPVPGVIIANPAVSGVISGKLILTAGLIQSILWRELALCFDFYSYQARALRALGLLLADGTPTVGGGMTF